MPVIDKTTAKNDTPNVEAQLLAAVAALTEAVRIHQEAIDSLRTDLASLGELVTAR